LERDKKELDKMKFIKISKFRQELSEYTFLRDIYKFESISYQSMQDLLNGTIKKWKDLEYANEEVTLLYKYVEKEDIFIIDAFFINTEKK
ncbi:MAG: hypothetical protein Q4C98_10785, partial [Capnocytophaga sp.]|nr:hypothetical protein [Capnocytophaga sp.]